MGQKSNIGYRKPPLHTRFKPGQSGNPRGRKKGVKNLKTIFIEELTAPVTVNESGRRRKITRHEALIKGLVMDALKGNDRARKLVIDTFVQLERSGSLDAAAQQNTLADKDLIARLKTRLIKHSEGKG
jgi:hypothetical protein